MSCIVICNKNRSLIFSMVTSFCKFSATVNNSRLACPLQESSPTQHNMSLAIRDSDPPFKLLISIFQVLTMTSVFMTARNSGHIIRAWNPQSTSSRTVETTVMQRVLRIVDYLGKMNAGAAEFYLQSQHGSQAKDVTSLAR